MKTLSEISKIVLALPPIVSGFLEHRETLEEHVVSKVPGGAGSTIKGQRYVTEYRCFLRTDGKHAERIADSSARAALEVLEAIGVPCPISLV